MEQPRLSSSILAVCCRRNRGTGPVGRAGGIVKRRRIKPGEQVTIRISQHDQQLIQDLLAVDPEYAARLREVPGKSHLVGEYTLDDLEDILGHIAAEANHTDDRKLRDRLDTLYERLLGVQQSYDDGNWQDSAV